jgi:DNA-binding transcriptional LysR family regulator
MTTPQIPLPSRRYLRNGMLPQLAAFEAVVRLGSATRAAEALCVAQPTLSGQLRKLSEALGVRLFALQGKRLVPTDAALVLLQTAHEVFAALDRCEPALAGLRSRDTPAFVASAPEPVPAPGDHADLAAPPGVFNRARPGSYSTASS